MFAHGPAFARAAARAAVCSLVVCSILQAGVCAAQSRENLLTHLQQQLRLSERQARGAVGALLAYAEHRLNREDFAELCRRIPNAQRIVQEVKLQGIVTGPLDDTDDFEAALSNVGIGQPLAAQFGARVLEYLAAAGQYRERDLLAKLLH